MNLSPIVFALWRRNASRAIVAACFFAVLLGALLLPAPASAQGAPRIIGRVDGDDFAIEAEPGSPAANIPTIAGQMVSGAHVNVKSGQARVTLDSGGTISACGSARFQILSSNGAITIVLEYGELDLHLDASSNVVIYTPLIVATPLSIGGGERETLVGLAHSGDMCLRAPHGAARVEQQLSGQSLLVPQFGELSLSGGQVVALKSPNGTCACQVEEARLKRKSSGPTVTVETMGAVASSSAQRESAAPAQPMRAPAQPPAQQPPQAAPQIPVAAPAPAPGLAPATAQADPAPPPVLFNGPAVQPPQAPRAAPPAAAQPQPPADDETPIYKVLVPPLTFDAFNPAPPPNLNPETIVLVRSVHVQQDVVFHDRVEGKSKSGTAVASANPSAKSAQPQSHGFFTSMGHFFRHIFG